MISKPEEIQDKCYLYINICGMQWFIYDMMLTFELQENLQKYDKNPIPFDNIQELCHFFLRERKGFSFRELKTFKVNLSGDVYDYTVDGFLESHAPHLTII